MTVYWNNIAALAYEKYARIMNRSRVPGTAAKAKPEKFEHLEATEQMAWIEAVQEACDVYTRAMLA
jgi:hypothetical protein